MNRSIWTWIQLAVSVSNAMFLVLSHVPGNVTAADIASLLGGQPGYRMLAKAAQGVSPLRHVEATP